jgi:hypothetical protein
MIERYFVKGLEFNWAKPPPQNSNRDGTIVLSATAAPAMTYTGLYNLNPVGIMQTAARAVIANGLNPGFNVPHVWLDYVYGRTTYVQPGGTDVLTGWMSGCWICTWQQGGARRVGHVGTISDVGKDQPPNTTVKQTFSHAVWGLVAHADPRLSGYSPASVWSKQEQFAIRSEFNLAVNILSLVTSNGEFYSIALMQKHWTLPNDWVCGGRRKATQTSGMDIYHVFT